MTEEHQDLIHYSNRRFRRDLHYRLKLLAAQLNWSLQKTHNYVVEYGLNAIDKQLAEHAKVKLPK